MKHYSIIALTLLLQACTVGPDYVRPEPPANESYTSPKETKIEQIGEQKIQAKKTVSDHWWKEFSSPELDALVEKGIQNNHSLAAAKKDLEQAEEVMNASKGQLWPFLSMDVSGGRKKYGASFLGPLDFIIPPFTYYQFGPSMTYLLDIFGQTRRVLENQQALTDYAAHVYDAAYLSFTGKIVNMALNIAVINAQIDAAEAMVRDDKKNLKLTENSFKIGAATQYDVLTAQNQLTTDKVLLPKLRLQLKEAKNELNILVSSAPSEWEAPNFKLSQFKLPKELPLSLPSELVRTRPDILAAESLLHAANANIGVATANLYPRIVLTGAYLQEALTPGALFQSSSGAWSYLGDLTAPLFNGGALQAQKRVAARAYESALANYQDVVVKSLVQVNDVLHALKYNEDSQQLGKQTLATAKTAYDLAKKGNDVGATGTLAVLVAERRYREAQLVYARVEGQRYLDTVQLYLVLGGRDFQAENSQGK